MVKRQKIRICRTTQGSTDRVQIIQIRERFVYIEMKKGKLVSKSELQNYLDEGWVLGIARKTV